jgi:hypothetical protein
MFLQHDEVRADANASRATALRPPDFDAERRPSRHLMFYVALLRKRCWRVARQRASACYARRGSVRSRRDRQRQCVPDAIYFRLFQFARRQPPPPLPSPLIAAA